MEARNNGTSRAACVTYTECDWGDLIEGTKDQLQALGLGVGLGFPGEPGCPRRELVVRDPRGYPASISNRYSKDGQFAARVTFPRWPAMPSIFAEGQETQFADGVMRIEHTGFDEYVGCATYLATAGLVQLDQLPGMPGMRKTMVTIYADGSMPGRQGNEYSRLREPGARRMERASTEAHRVTVYVSEDERDRRQALVDRAMDLWRSAVHALTRPSRLQPIAGKQALTGGCGPRWGAGPSIAEELRPRQHLRLVWSVPDVATSTLTHN